MSKLQPRSLLGDDRMPTGQGGAFKLGEPHLRHQRAQMLKDKVKSRYDEAIGFAMPGRDGIDAGPDQSSIYDDTAVIATPEFASRMQQGIMPMFARWASFAAGVLVAEEAQRQEFQAALDKVCVYLFELINASNFGTEANEAIMDLALGTGAVRIDESAGDNPFLCRVVPLRGLAFGIGPHGEPDPIYETRVMPLAHVKVHYPAASIPPSWRTMDGCIEVKLVEVWERDWNEPEKALYRMSVYAPDADHAILLQEDHEGAGCCPVFVFRWSKMSGEAWGRGPLFNILPSLRKVNFAERALLDHTDIQIAGIWTIEDDGVINPDTVVLEPGTLVPRAPGSAGLQNVAPKGDFDIAQFVLEESRANIRKAMFTEQLGNPNKTPMSATEVQQRMSELARAIGSSFGRLIFELTMPAMSRFLYIAKKRGLVQVPVIDGKQVKLISTSPLAQAQNLEDIEATNNYLTMLQERFGQEMLNIVVDAGLTAVKLADKFQVTGILRPPQQQMAIVNQVSQAMAGQQGPKAAMAGAMPGGQQAGGGPVPGGQPAGGPPAEPAALAAGLGGEPGPEQL